MTIAVAPRVLAAIVNYNRADLTLETAASLLVISGEAPMRIVAIDSASQPHDVERLRAGLPVGVEIAELPVNAGYGAACNAAIKAAMELGVPYVWLLNNDLAFEPGCLGELVRCLDEGPELAAVGPVVVEFDRPDVILSSGIDVRMRFGRISHRRFGRATASLPGSPETVDALEASAVLVRVDAAKAAGGFDEEFFMYSEDVEWSLRVREHSWTLACSPAARVRHRGSQSSAPLDRIEYMIRNRIRSVRLHGSRANQWTFMAYMILGWLPAFAVMRLLRRFGPVAAVRSVVRPLAWNFRDAVRRRHWRLTAADQRIGPRARGEQVG